MITIKAEGTVLKAVWDMPDDLVPGKKNYIVTLMNDFKGDDFAMAALAKLLQERLDKRIRNIRKFAYLQGVKDRANKATEFDAGLGTTSERGGCWL